MRSWQYNRLHETRVAPNYPVCIDDDVRHLVEDGMSVVDAVREVRRWDELRTLENNFV